MPDAEIAVAVTALDGVADILVPDGDIGRILRSYPDDLSKELAALMLVERATLRLQQLVDLRVLVVCRIECTGDREAAVEEVPGISAASAEVAAQDDTFSPSPVCWRLALSHCARGTSLTSSVIPICLRF